MIVLALDTTTRAGSVALARDGRILDVFVGDESRTHAARLPGDLLECLGHQGLSLRDVDLFGVAAGPGSFTGLRIGIATIQGLAFALDRPVVAVSTLDAITYDLWEERGRNSGVMGVWMDAQRREVFGALYQAGTDGLPKVSEGSVPGTAAGLGELSTVHDAEVGFPADVLERWRPSIEARATGSPALLVGDGAVRYRAIVEASSLSPRVEVLDRVASVAPAIARIAYWRAQRGFAVTPHAIQPVYVRRPDAELARDRRALASSTGKDLHRPGEQP